MKPRQEKACLLWTSQPGGGSRLNTVCAVETAEKAYVVKWGVGAVYVCGESESSAMKIIVGLTRGVWGKVNAQKR